jgi:hypothetical protein
VAGRPGHLTCRVRRRRVSLGGHAADRAAGFMRGP